MRALGAKNLLQIIIGAGQLGHGRTMQQAGPGAPADLQKVPHRGREAPGLGLRLPPGPAQPVPPPLHGGPCVRGVMRQDGRGAMDPAIGSTPLRPQRRRRVPPTPQDRPQAPSGLGHGPLFSTRSRLSVMALRRAWSCRPAAAKGGRPSSVRALRTARQYPRMTSASGSVRPSTARAKGRTPRTCFLRTFLAWRSAS
jgi:hypothetical protein